jgi:hypothetical protein
LGGNTNEPCPRLWFAEMCFASESLDLPGPKRATSEAAYAGFEKPVRLVKERP